MAGKGDKSRPFSVSRRQFEANWSAINWRKKKVSEYQRGKCCVCDMSIYVESGCAPLCGSHQCDVHYERRVLRQWAEKIAAAHTLEQTEKLLEEFRAES